MTLPLWLDEPHDPAPPLSGEHRCDVVVIGAGLCGASAALALARQGVDVAIVEADVVSGAASGRNAGFILQGTAERYDRALTVMGAERARRIHAYSLDNHAGIRRFVEESGLDCGYRCAGSLQLAGTEQEEAELVESARLLQRDGFQARLLVGDDLPALYRDAGFRVGVHLPQDGEVHPARLVRGAVRAAVDAGARLFEHSPVTVLDADSPGDVRVQTAAGQLRADIALVCTNARVGQLLPWYADKVDPVRGQMLGTAPAPRVFSWPIYADHGFDYWRQDEQGRIALGGWRNLDPDSEVGLDDRLHDDIQARMEAFLRRFAPLKEIEITHRWSGIMGFSRDGLPMIGPAPGAPGALAAAGFTGHGFGFAWLAGEALAAVALEGQHPFATELSPRRFG